MKKVLVLLALAICCTSGAQAGSVSEENNVENPVDCFKALFGEIQKTGGK